MTKSALQIARAAYQPKVPAALKGAVKAVDGEYTQSVADQDEIKKLFQVCSTVSRLTTQLLVCMALSSDLVV